MTERTYYDNNEIYSSSEYPVYTRERRVRQNADADESERREFFLKTVAAQVVVCLILFGLLFAYKKTNSHAFTLLKEKYNTIILRDMSMNEIAGAFKTVAAFAIKPQGEWKADESTTEPVSQTEAAVPDNDNEFLPEEDDTLTGKGGEDISLAAANTTFSPVFITEKMLNPVEKFEVTSVFGYRVNPITKKYGFHTGVDLAAKEGDRIFAVLDGTVTQVGENDVRGKFIVLSHKNSITTTYYHCNEILAQKGAILRQGEVIAKVGSTGWSTGPHLHFEVKIGSLNCNPLFLLTSK